ncbi:MAG: phosphatase PAP2 family protein [Candidatus Sulfobium sp.]|jgi:membrane-associated phospholipid phosphatase
MAETLLKMRPADLLNVLFLAFLLAVTVVFHQRIDHPWAPISLYLALLLCQGGLIFFQNRNSVVRLFYDILFPLISILCIFDSLGWIVHSVNPRDIDPLLIRLDFMLFNGTPALMLEKMQTPLLTDVLQVSYSSYYFLPLILGFSLKANGENLRFERSLFLVMLCFYLSYIGYLLWPALGPRFSIQALQETRLSGFLIADPVRDLLNRLEGIKRDAFPSGHTGVSLVVLYLAFRFRRRLFWFFLPVVMALIFSTVYCRYHYVVDVIAGIALTLVTIIIGETYYGYRSKRIHTDS